MIKYFYLGRLYWTDGLKKIRIHLKKWLEEK